MPTNAYTDLFFSVLSNGALAGGKMLSLALVGELGNAHLSSTNVKEVIQCLMRFRHS